MNFTVHSLMYSYYALRAMNYRVPRYVAMIITTLQLSQMVAGCAVNLWAYQVRLSPSPNNTTRSNFQKSQVRLFDLSPLFETSFKEIKTRCYRFSKTI